jgi:hypothetical protein
MTQQLVTDFFGKKRSAATPVAIPEAKKKRRRKTKTNTILLSKTAMAVLQVTTLTDGEANLVGQFCGTDIRFYKVGDLYVPATERIGLHGTGIRTHQHIQLLNPGPPRGTHRWLLGKTFRVYEVERRTASRIRVKLLRTFTAYTKWNQLQNHEPFDANKVAGVFRWKLQYAKSQTIMPGFTDYAAELEALKKRYGVRDANGKSIRYKCNDDWKTGGELVLVDYAGRVE